MIHATKRPGCFRQLNGTQKLQYIWDYYKLPVIFVLLVLFFVSSWIYGKFTKKETVLYTAFINVAAGDTLTRQLGSGFLEWARPDQHRQEVSMYTGLYLSDKSTTEHQEYVYASRMKLLAAIDAEQLDVVLMDKEAFDAFAQNGYLCDLKQLLESDPALYELLKDLFVTNIEILEDNSLELRFDNTLSYSAKTQEYLMGIDLSQTALMKNAGFADTVYMGILKNSPRKETALEYLKYILT